MAQYCKKVTAGPTWILFNVFKGNCTFSGTYILPYIQKGVNQIAVLPLGELGIILQENLSGRFSSNLRAKFQPNKEYQIADLSTLFLGELFKPMNPLR